MRIGIWLAAVLACGAAAAQDLGGPDIAARIELTPIQTLTLPDGDFLRGDASAAKPTIIAGAFRAAQGPGRHPAVVMIHGSGGIGGNFDPWERLFNAMGVSTFVIDGFTGRGLQVTNVDQSRLGRLNLVLDSYRALAILAKNPRVDPARIAVMGFSRGGQAALYASVARFNRMWNQSGVQFAAYLPFYPDCATTYIDDALLAGGPVHVFGGLQDDYNPIGRCMPYIGRVATAGHAIGVTTYPNASHSFDNPLGSRIPEPGVKSQTVRDCVVQEGPEGVLVNMQTGAPFTYADACVALGPHTGYDPDATSAARAEVTGMLRQVFRLE